MIFGARPGIGVLCWLGLLGVAVAAPAGLWLNVPYVKQPKEGCGAACIVMVLKYWVRKDPGFHRAVPDVGAVQSELYSSADHGIRAQDMASYLRNEGMRVFTFRGSWNAIDEHLSKGRPLIVCLKEGHGLDRTLHYVVVTGIDTGRGLALLNDPATRKQKMVRRAVFEKKWRGEDNWTLLAVPQS